jgi:DNA polymerase
VGKSDRQIGKTTELSAGYGGAYAAWVSMAATLHVEIPERSRVLEIVRAWREAHPALCDWDTGLWKKLDDAARQAIMNPGKTFEAGEYIRFERWREWLRMQLPSGGFLNYAAPAIIDDPRRPGSNTVSYMGVNNYTKKWERLTTYGGKLSADATQATAREIMAENLPYIEDEGYLPVLLVHDEVVTEVPDTDDFSVDRLNQLLSAKSEWAKGLPLAAGGFEAYRYRKE